MNRYLPLLTVIGTCLALGGLGSGCEPDRSKLQTAPVYFGGKLLKTESFYLGSSGQKVLHGKQTEYFDNGKVRLEAEYADGKLHGLLTEYGIGYGKPVRQGRFVQGEEDGPWMAWFDSPQGEVEQEVTYGHGRIVGKDVYYSTNPYHVSFERFHDSRGEIEREVAWYREGVKEHEGRYKGSGRTHEDARNGGIKDGVWTYWNADGSVRAVGVWKDGKPWSGACGVLAAGDAGSWGGLMGFYEYDEGTQTGRAKAAIERPQAPAPPAEAPVKAPAKSGTAPRKGTR